MESNAIAVRLEIEAPEIDGDPVVLVNGAPAAKRDFKIEARDGTLRGVLYVQVAQKVERKDEHGRTLRIDVRAKTKPGTDQKVGKNLSASTQVVARW